MYELLKILNDNNIKYIYSFYANEKCIIIKKNGYQLQIYYRNGFVSDLQKIPYSWGRMGSTSINGIIDDLRNYLKIKINDYQLSLFDFS